MVKVYLRFMLPLLLAGAAALCVSAQEKPEPHVLTFIVLDENSVPVPGATAVMADPGIWGISDDKGKIILQSDRNLVGKSWELTMMGFKSEKGSVTGDNLRTGITVRLKEESLSLNEVRVVAENGSAGEATSSIIGRQALDHLQATSLKDVLQMIPGQVQLSNPSLIGSQSFSVRDLSSDANSSFGSTVVRNGVALSRNANLPSSNSSMGEGDTGTDLRRLGTDDIESVEIIRGVASAEYGDLTSGLMIVNSKVGMSDLKVRSKIMPGIIQASAGKGFNLKKNNTLNFSIDYANGHSDPRYATDKYDRASVSAAHRKVLSGGKWVMTTHADFTYTYEWSGADPDEPVALQKYYSRTNDFSFLLSHDGKVNVGLPGLGTLKYLVATTFEDIDSYKESLVNVGGGAIFDSTMEGMWEGTAYPYGYETVTGTDSKPLTFLAKVSDNFNLDAGEILKNKFNLGIEWKSEGNMGYGKWDNSPQYKSFEEKRLRRYRDIPFLNQGSFFAEVNSDLHFTDKCDFPSVKLQAGVRGSTIQMFTDRQMCSLSPRINLSLEVCKWFSLRGAYGLSHKMPSLLTLYPDLYYYDFYNQKVSDSTSDFIHYTTNIFDVSNASLKPMQNRKFELGADFRTDIGQTFSVIAYYEKSDNAFASLDDSWVSISYDRWYSRNFDKSQPEGHETVITKIDIPGNGGTKVNKGIEFDFNLGRIRRTNTSFYLSGAWTGTESSSNGKYYRLPVGCTATYSDVYVVYPEGTDSSKELRRMSSTLRIVQHIPAIRFVVTASAQCVFKDYSFSSCPVTVPVGYVSADNEAASNGEVSSVTYTAFSQEELASATATFGHGYMVKDQIFDVASANTATEWPAVWALNLRVTKEFGKIGSLSFYVNNFLFQQPWQRSTTSANEVERNGSFLSYGLELSLNF